MATGVSGDIPRAIKVSASSRKRFNPIKMTLVPGMRAISSKFKSESSFSGSSCPVRTVKVEATIAMGEGNARVIRRRHDGRNPGHDFKRNFRRREFLGFFAAAPKNIRIAALQPHDAFALARFGNHERVELILREGIVGAAAAARNKFRGRRREAEQIRIGERRHKSPRPRAEAIPLRAT